MARTTLLLAAALLLAGVHDVSARTLSHKRAALTLRDPPSGALWDYIANASQFTIIADMLMEAGLDEVIKRIPDDQPATLLLPTDIAFAFFMPEVGDVSGLMNISGLDAADFYTDLLGYHVISDMAINLTEAAAGEGLTVEASNGETMAIVNGSGGHATVIDQLGRITDIYEGLNVTQIGEAFVYSMPRVLIPYRAATIKDMFYALPGSFSYMAACMELIESDLLTNATAEVTVLAPFNEAWERYAERYNVSLPALTENVTACADIVAGALIPSAAMTAAGLEVGQVLMTAYEEADWTVRMTATKQYTYIYFEGSEEFGVRTPFAIEVDLKAGRSVVHGVDLLTPPNNIGYGNYYADEYYADP
ncbi:hypothetical protein FOA52_003632 [Chlamydomonas sp. UWO 241]|nr:hypothetical protein FOA52_003632 [Chlamydomonas sp. UWO 241]